MVAVAKAFGHDTFEHKPLQNSDNRSCRQCSTYRGIGEQLTRRRIVDTEHEDALGFAVVANQLAPHCILLLPAGIVGLQAASIEGWIPVSS
jgi:hypothetical protein|eukprot:COSAG02_NODE_1092_length_14622_cov_95.061971_9_plen_91_part_00